MLADATQIEVRCPIGRISITTTENALTEIRFLGGKMLPDGEFDAPASRGLMAEVLRQLRAYFNGKLRRFDLPLDPQGTPFQLRVWKELQKIPYGETQSYLQIAQAIGKPTGSRAVGMANGRNPIPIVIPCHRVIGASGKLVGFGGGLPTKQRLLLLENPEFRLIG